MARKCTKIGARKSCPKPRPDGRMSERQWRVMMLETCRRELMEAHIAWHDIWKHEFLLVESVVALLEALVRPYDE